MPRAVREQQGLVQLLVNGGSALDPGSRSRSWEVPCLGPVRRSDSDPPSDGGSRFSCSVCIRHWPACLASLVSPIRCRYAPGTCAIMQPQRERGQGDRLRCLSVTERPGKKAASSLTLTQRPRKLYKKFRPRQVKRLSEGRSQKAQMRALPFSSPQPSPSTTPAPEIFQTRPSSASGLVACLLFLRPSFSPPL